MDCTFQVGQKIVCIYKDWTQEWFDIGYTLPVYGGQYTVQSLAIHDYRKQHTNEQFMDVAVLLKEIRNPPKSWGAAGIYELGFPHILFKPLDEKKAEQKKETGITLLKQFERPNPIKIKDFQNV